MLLQPNQIPRAAHAPRSAGISLLWALIAIGGVLYGSLLPFQFDGAAAAKLPLRDLNNLSFQPTSVEDVVTNLIIYLPVGGLLMAATLIRKRHWLLRWPLALLPGFGLSVFVECLQTVLVGRVSSLTDVILNSAGTVMGALLAAPALDVTRAGLRRARQSVRTQPLRSLHLAVTAGLVVFLLGPFDLVTSTPAMHEALSRAQLSLMPALANGPLDYLPDGSAALSTLWFAIWAYTSFLSLCERGTNRELALLHSTFVGMLFAAGLESVQLFTRSHVFEMSAMMWHVAAIPLGSCLALWLSAGLPVPRWKRYPRLVLPTGLVLSVLICHVAILAGPTLGTLLNAGQADPQTVGAPLPFEALWRQAMLLSAYEMSFSAGKFAFLAMSLALCLRRLGFARPWLGVVVFVGASTLLLECFAALPTASWPDLTQPIIALLAASVAGSLYTALRPAENSAAPASAALRQAAPTPRPEPHRD